MTDREQANAFETELNQLINRFRDEYDISYADMIGILQVKQHQLCCELLEDDED